jgi:hypothetical protein
MSMLSEATLMLKQFEDVPIGEIAAPEAFGTIAAMLQLRGLTKRTAILCAARMDVQLPSDCHMTDPDGFQDLCEAFSDMVIKMYKLCLDVAGGNDALAEEALLAMSHQFSMKLV